MKIKTFEDVTQAEVSMSIGRQQLDVSVFLIDRLLIDTGPYRAHNLLIPLFEQWEIDDCILTHHHEDHTGLAYWIQQNKEVTLHMHELGAEYGKKRGRIPLYRRLVWGKRAPFQAKLLENTFKTEHYTWEIIHTPGHAEDHIALFLREKGWLFGGDLQVNPNPKSAYRFESIPTMIQSLRKVLTYNFDTYICSHDGFIFNGKKVIKNKLDNLIQIQQEVLFLFNKGMTVHEIRRELFPNKHMMHYISFFENSPIHLIRSIIEPNNNGTV